MSEQSCGESIEARLGRDLQDRGRTLATAESCTGGLVGHRLTNVPGSSAHYLGGVICYANAVKATLLQVPWDLLEQQGAVSDAVARQMARGVRGLLGADIGIAVTGIAGPGGGTAEKPVGLVYIALAAEGVEICERHRWPYDRQGNKEASAQRALQMVLEYLQKEL